MAEDECLSYFPQLVAKSESLTRSIPRSFLVTSLADFAAGLDYDLLLCPVRALRLYLLRARSLSTGRHRLFVSPRRPARPFLRTRCRSFGGGDCCCSGGYTSGWIPPGSQSLQRVHLCRIPPSLVGCLISHLGLQFGVFLNITLATFNTNLMVYFLLVTSWLRVLG